MSRAPSEASISTIRPTFDSVITLTLIFTRLIHTYHYQLRVAICGSIRFAMQGGGEDSGNLDAPACARPSEIPSLVPTDRLYIPHRKRLAHGYVTSTEGVKE